MLHVDVVDDKPFPEGKKTKFCYNAINSQKQDPI
jgi:hypothetical protein